MAQAHVLDAFDLSDRAAVVTGGGSGIGRQIAVGLADVGASVVVIGRREDRLQETVRHITERGGTAAHVTADLRDAKSISDVFASAAANFGRLDILVNNAGVTLVKPSTEVTVEDWDRILQVNLRSVFFCSAAAIAHFHGSGGGVILNIASIGALRGGAGVYSAYSASKGGVVSLTRSHAVEWAAANVRVNCIVAGAFHTEMSRRAYEDPELHARYVRRIPRGRTGSPEEIAPLAVYLSAPASDFITGEAFVIDGGQVMR